jgi:glutamine synthetase
MYLAIAAIIAAGTQGVVDAEDLIWQDCQKDPANLSGDERMKMGIKHSLPKDLNEALAELGADVGLTRKLGEQVVKRYIAVKTAEMKMLDGIPAEDRKAWIIDRY